MDLRTNEELPSEDDKCAIAYYDEQMDSCPTCRALLNEIIELRMELGRKQEQEKKPAKHFSIESTLYTFYNDRTSNSLRIRFEPVNEHSDW